MDYRSKKIKKAKRINRSGLFHLPIYIKCILYSLIVLVPIIWVILSSFKGSIEFFKDPFGLPSEIILSNFNEAWGNGNVGIYFRNSIFVTSISVFFIIGLSAPASYALSRLRFIGRINILVLFVSGLFIPAALLILPIFLLLKDLNILGSFLGLILIYISYSFSFTIFVLVPFFNMIPKELEEAAFLDGASYFQVFLRVIIPLARPGIILAAIFNVFGIWNEIIIGWTLISDEGKRTLPIGLAHILVKQHYSANYGVLFAAVTITVAPILILYIIFQRNLTGKLLQGGLKE